MIGIAKKITLKEKQCGILSQIVTSRTHRGTIYTGVTSNLIQRVFQHKEDLVDGFTKKYDVHQLVYYEVHLDIREAILREK